ncbi:MAG: carboxypeptidase regulatory-like domain-containing protein [Myxococcales bacterium]
MSPTPWMCAIRRWSRALALAALASCSTRLPTAPAGGLRGEVLDASGRPLAGARVRLQATPVSTVTAESGEFTLPVDPDHVSGVVAAWKEGYFNGGEKLVPGRRSYRIVLRAIQPGDDRGYTWASPRERARAEGDDRAACEKCHPVLVAEWEGSAHAGSATNPLFLAVFEGKDRLGRPTGGPAYRLDFPSSRGTCAACHVPALAVNAPFDTDPAAARGVAAQGVTCDVCHKIRDAAVDATGGRPGVLSFTFARPVRGKDAFFGQLDDVIAGPDSFRALYRESRYCAPCHHGSFWGVRAYPEFSEWAASGYARKNVQCQDCHMKLRGGPRRFALEKEGAALRDPATISSHVQYGLNDEAFMRSALTYAARAEVLGDRIRVRVSIKNSGAGHHVPTGSPMRNMVLLVEANDAQGAPLPLVQGERVPEWAGRGSPSRGDYAGLPGKGFAKVLADIVEYPADPTQGRQFARFRPTPYWRPAQVVSDTRIAAEATDASEYVFAASGARGPITVRTALVYRRTFRTWGALDRVKGGDLELASSSEAVSR